MSVLTLATRIMPPMPKAAPSRLPTTSREGAAAVYVPSCVNRIFGLSRAQGNGSALRLPEAVVAVSARARLPVWIPPDVGGHCCAVPWSSKGYDRGLSRGRVAGAAAGSRAGAPKGAQDGHATARLTIKRAFVAQKSRSLARPSHGGAVTGPPLPGSGGVLVVGDSLEELTSPFLQKYLPSTQLTINVHSPHDPGQPDGVHRR